MSTKQEPLSPTHDFNRVILRNIKIKEWDINETIQLIKEQELYIQDLRIKLKQHEDQAKLLENNKLQMVKELEILLEEANKNISMNNAIEKLDFDSVGEGEGDFEYKKENYEHKYGYEHKGGRRRKKRRTKKRRTKRRRTKRRRTKRRRTKRRS